MAENDSTGTALAALAASCPLEILSGGPASERAELTCNAIHQIAVLLAELLDQLAGEVTEEEALMRNLVSRARSLAESAYLLFADPDDSAGIAHAVEDVRHG